MDLSVVAFIENTLNKLMSKYYLLDADGVTLLPEAHAGRKFPAALSVGSCAFLRADGLVFVPVDCRPRLYVAIADRKSTRLNSSH